MQVDLRRLAALAPAGVAAGITLPWLTLDLCFFAGAGFVLVMLFAWLARWREWFASSTAVAGALGVTLLPLAVERDNPFDQVLPFVVLAAGAGLGGAVLLRLRVGPLAVGWLVLPCGLAALLASAFSYARSTLASSAGVALLLVLLALCSAVWRRELPDVPVPASKSAAVPAIGLASAAAVMAAAATGSTMPWWMIGSVAGIGLVVALVATAEGTHIVESVIAVLVVGVLAAMCIGAVFSTRVPALPLQLCAVALALLAIERAIARGRSFLVAAVAPAAAVATSAVLVMSIVAV